MAATYSRDWELGDIALIPRQDGGGLLVGIFSRRGIGGNYIQVGDMEWFAVPKEAFFVRKREVTPDAGMLIGRTFPDYDSAFEAFYRFAKDPDVKPNK